MLFCLITGAAQNNMMRNDIGCFARSLAQLHESYVVLPDHSGECDTRFRTRIPYVPKKNTIGLSASITSKVLNESTYDFRL